LLPPPLLLLSLLLSLLLLSLLLSRSLVTGPAQV
jgi:hypothetical protein